MRKILLIVVSAILLSACTQKTAVKEIISPEPTIILPTGLPNKHLIKTAFVPQAPEKNWDQPWQDACEEAAILTVHYYYQNKNPNTSTLLSDYQQLLGQSSVHDINISQMANIAENLYGYQSKIIDNPSLDDIKQYLSKDIPVIVVGNGKTLFKENKHFKSGGPWYHSLVILGYDDTVSEFIVHDVGTQFGAYFHYSYSTLLSSIHDFPKSGQKEQIDTGDKKILILVK